MYLGPKVKKLTKIKIRNQLKFFIKNNGTDTCKYGASEYAIKNLEPFFGESMPNSHSTKVVVHATMLHVSSCMD